MKRNTFGTIFILLAFCLSCNPADDSPGVNCSPIEVEPLNFSENTRAWYPYRGSENLVFQNEAGQEIHFKRNEPFDSIFAFRYDAEYELPRTGCPDDIRVRYNYPAKIGLYESDSLGFFIYADIQVAPIEGLFPPTFFEALQVNVGEYQSENSSLLMGELVFITDNEGALCAFDTTACEEYELLESVMLRDKTFENVYFKPGAGQAGDMYHHLTMGLVGFEDFVGSVWVLERVE